MILSVTVVGLTPSTWYRFAITSSDAAGNESTMRTSQSVKTKPSSCGISNNWIGGSSNWGDNSENWSENAVANSCQSVLIDNGSAVTIPVGESYACTTFEVGIGSEFNVIMGSEFHVIPSQTGTHSLIIGVLYAQRDCISNGKINCPFLVIDDSMNCTIALYGSDIIYPATYMIVGDILTVSIDFLNDLCIVFRIIDDNNIIEVESPAIWSSN